jgi:DMSO reductase anchor subunit
MGEFLDMRHVLGFFFVFEACAVDVYRSLRGSWLVGVTLLCFYLFVLSVGLLIGAIVFEIAQPIIRAATVDLSPAAQQALELSLLFLFLYSVCFFTTFLARLSVRFAAYLLYELRGAATFFLIVLAAAICVVIALALGLMPPVLPEWVLVRTAGCFGLCALLFALLSIWIQVRYRSTQNMKTRNIDHEIGIAWDHMTDPRRTRFSFYRDGA